jgi:hypothetical protein
MTKHAKIAGGIIGSIIAIGLLSLGLAVILQIHPANGVSLYTPEYNYDYGLSATTTPTSCIVLATGQGVLHSLAVGTAGANSVITLYDSGSASVSAMTAATATIFVGPLAGATSTATGTLSFSLEGVTLTTASLPNGSSTTDAANAIGTAIQASSSILNVSVATSTNFVTITSDVTGVAGNIILPAIAPQNGFTFSNTFTNSGGTQIISRTSLAPTSTYQNYPETGLYDAIYKQGLCIQETVATSSVTVGWQQQ